MTTALEQRQKYMLAAQALVALGANFGGYAPMEAYLAGKPLTADQLRRLNESLALYRGHLARASEPSYVRNLQGKVYALEAVLRVPHTVALPSLDGLAAHQKAKAAQYHAAVKAWEGDRLVFVEPGNVPDSHLTGNPLAGLNAAFPAAKWPLAGIAAVGLALALLAGLRRR